MSIVETQDEDRGDGALFRIPGEKRPACPPPNMVVHRDAYATVWHGDCLQVMRSMPSSSVDAIVTDPPYGLTEIDEAKTRRALTEWLSGNDEFVPDGRGFMSKEWDRFVPPPAVWREAMRVVKPGGYMLCFAGSRTIDLMTLSVRLGGWEIRDTIEWIYGCLTDDAEILTESGWKPGIDVKEGERVAQWDSASGSISLAAVEEKFLAPWDGKMRVLRNSDTDQVLTPNHRVYHRTKVRKQVDGVRTPSWPDEWAVSEAREISTYKPVRLPVSGEHDGPGIGGDDYAALLGWVWTEGGFDNNGNGVRITQSSVNQEKVDEIEALVRGLVPTSKLYERDRTYVRRNGEDHAYTESSWFFTGDVATRVRRDLPEKQVSYELLWRMSLSEKRAFLRAAMLGDGTGWDSKSQQFFQKEESSLEWFQALLHLTGMSGKFAMRKNRDAGQVYLRDRSTTELQARHLRDSEVDYKGDVWCVKVPTGAFVARRNGHIFITGNSGFPKSLNIAKEMDKKSGFVGTVIGTEKVDIGMQGGQMHTGRPKNVIDREIRELSPDAKKWDGWGTALKPAHEPIIVARKPLAGRTVVENVDKYGTGGINIEATRFGDGHRFPPNVVFSHVVGCVAGGSCADGCPVDALNEQSGILSAGNHPANRAGLGSVYTGGSERSGTEQERRTTEPGGASRSFPAFRYKSKAKKSERPTYEDDDGETVAHSTVKPVELIQWALSLVVPPKGLVLDIFLGSGTTSEAATLLAMDSIGVEVDETHIPLIIERLTGKDIWAEGLLD